MRQVIIVAVAMLLPIAASAQIIPNPEALQEQLVPESFKLSASATAEKVPYHRLWRTSITYSIANDSGMNLYVGISQQGLAIGSCTEVESATSGLPLLPPPTATVYAAPIGSGEPRGIYVPSGVRVGGTIVMAECEAPNPGSPTAQLSLTLMLGKKPSFTRMFTYPMSADVPVRQLRN